MLVVTNPAAAGTPRARGAGLLQRPIDPPHGSRHESGRVTMARPEINVFSLSFSLHRCGWLVILIVHITLRNPAAVDRARAAHIRSHQLEAIASAGEQLLARLRLGRGSGCALDASRSRRVWQTDPRRRASSRASNFSPRPGGDRGAGRWLAALERRASNSGHRRQQGSQRAASSPRAIGST
jgi:hypothetical protein